MIDPGTILQRLARAGWKLTAVSEVEPPPKVHPSAREVMRPEVLEQPVCNYKVVATRELPGGHITVEVEAKSLEVMLDDLAKICGGVVVTE